MYLKILRTLMYVVLEMIKKELWKKTDEDAEERTAHPSNSGFIMFILNSCKTTALLFIMYFLSPNVINEFMMTPAGTIIYFVYKHSLQTPLYSSTNFHLLFFSC